MGHKPPMAFCKEGTCSDDNDGCPAEITTAGDGFPTCKIYDTETVLNIGDFDAAEGGGSSVFLDVFQPDEDCAVLIKSPASTTEPGCGIVVGSFDNAVCTKVNLRKTFMIQQCCGVKNCEDASGPPNMIRGLGHRRDLGSRSVEIKDKTGRVIEPIEVGYPPRVRRSYTSTRGSRMVRRKDDEDCKNYIPDGDIFTRPADAPQIVATGVDGGTGGTQVTISKARSVSQSTTFSAGINFAIFSASTELTFEQSITDTNQKTWNVPAGQTGKVGFTPTLKCTRGKLDCGEQPKGEACTGFREADEIAGTYAVIATS
ncbi:MAG: hypothetical protein Q9219_005727 [cf. Caloplaca sp. 3 TL-2023]